MQGRAPDSPGVTPSFWGISAPDSPGAIFTFNYWGISPAPRLVTLIINISIFCSNNLIFKIYPFRIQHDDCILATFTNPNQLAIIPHSALMKHAAQKLQGLCVTTTKENYKASIFFKQIILKQKKITGGKAMAQERRHIYLKPYRPTYGVCHFRNRRTMPVLQPSNTLPAFQDQDPL